MTIDVRHNARTDNGEKVISVKDLSLNDLFNKRKTCEKTQQKELYRKRLMRAAQGATINRGILTRSSGYLTSMNGFWDQM